MTLTSTRLDRPVVVGSGLAGLVVAVRLGRAAVISDSRMGSAWWSQTGLAAALSSEDSPEEHQRDSLSAGDGIGDPEAARVLAAEAPGAVATLSTLGVQFDRDLEGELLLGRERGHETPRVVRADGDATGAVLMSSLSSHVEAADDIDLINGRAVDLTSDGNRVCGVVVAQGNDRHVILAPAVILATGGAGRLYAQTTNPVGISGDGIVMASRAGAELADLEFVRFHPTALSIGKDPMPVLPHVLFEEGALVVDGSGRPFLPYTAGVAESPDALALQLYSRLRSETGAYLDLRAVPNLIERFPTPAAHALSVGLDPSEHLLPVVPAADLTIGGVSTDSFGRSSLPGLWAVGECASTGVHGGSGLAANYLLEAAVFGIRAADSVVSQAQSSDKPFMTPQGALDLPVIAGPAMDELRKVMWEHVGPIRSASSLREAKSALQSMETILNRTVEGRNGVALASMVIAAAESRTESRGSHQRDDYPAPDPSQQRRSLIRPVAVDRMESPSSP